MLLLWSTSALAVSFEALVADPVGTLLADPNTPSAFRIIALSHAAEACVGRHRDGDWTAERAGACVDNLAEAALDVRLSPYDSAVPAVSELGDHGLFLSHLAIVLGARDALEPSACDDVLHHKLASHLAERTLAHPSGVARSYPHTPARWPADQAATSYALWLYDRAHGTSLSSAPIARYLASLPAEGLPPSELTGAKAGAELPRGSALAFTVRYLAPVAPEVARSLWKRVRDAGFVGRVGPFVALREWPEGVDMPEDVDSGPIVHVFGVDGVGASATAFGRAAARAIRDDTAGGLDRTATLGFQVAKNTPSMQSTAHSSLATAMSAQASVDHPLGGAPR
jgi:hypothetical protein